MVSPLSEKMIMKLEVLRGDKLAKTNELFRRKVQLTEELKEVEDNLQYARGSMDSFKEFQEVVVRMEQAEKIEEMKLKKQMQEQPNVPEPVASGDGSHD